MGRHAAAGVLRLASQAHLLRSAGRRSVLAEAEVGARNSSSSSSSNGIGGAAENSSSFLLRASTSGSSRGGFGGGGGGSNGQQQRFPAASSRALSSSSSSSAGAAPSSSGGAEKEGKAKKSGGGGGERGGQGHESTKPPSPSSSPSDGTSAAATGNKEAAAAVAAAAAARLREAQAAAASAAANAAATAAATAQELRAQMGLGGPRSSVGGSGSGGGSDGASSSSSSTSTSSSERSEGSETAGAAGASSSWKDRLYSSSGAFSFSSLLSAVRREVAAAVLPEDPAASATRARRAEPAPASTSTSLAELPRAPKSAWASQWERMHDQLGSHPVFARLAAARDAAAGSAPARRARELREKALETWETSDHPFVHRLQGVSDAVFAETEMAQAVKEVRQRDPSFDFVRFLRSVRGDVPAVVAAYLAGDAAALSAHCSPDLVERVAAVHAASRAAQRASFSGSSGGGGSGSGGSSFGGGGGSSSATSIPDTSVLDVGEPELVDLKFLDGDPAAVVSFTCQQINCERDAFGNVVDGSPDDVQRVYYYWALVQDAAGFVGTDGVAYPPRWQIREMMVRGMHHLL